MYLVNDGKSAHATLPTQQKSTLLPRVPTHTNADCEISDRQPTRLYKEFSRIHNAGHSKKNDAHGFAMASHQWFQHDWGSATFLVILT